MSCVGPIFVVGMPRSGTTLMSSLLSSHPNIAIAPETHYLISRSNIPKKAIDSKIEDIELFFQSLTSSDYIQHLGIGRDTILDRISSSNRMITYRAVFTSMLEEYASKHKKNRWGEKTPGHYEYVETLTNWYPNCQIIWMVRDPRSVCSSYLDVPWSANHVLGPARRWLSSMRALENWSQDPRILIVKYEDLVQDPNDVMSNTLIFLGEPPFSDKKFATTRPVAIVGSHSGWHRRHLKSASNPVHKTSKDKWRNRLRPLQIRVIEQLCSTQMTEWEYELVVRPQPILSRICFIYSAAGYFFALMRTKKLWSGLSNRIRARLNGFET